MYDNSSLIYHIFSHGGVLLLLGMIGLLIDLNDRKKEKIKKKKKSIKGSFFLDGILIVIGLCFCFFFGYKAANPDVSVYEGYFSREYTRGGFMIRAYAFWGGAEDGRNPTFHLDSFSKKEIYPDDFAEGVKYRIYYETNTSIIMRVEICEEQEDGSVSQYHISLNNGSTPEIAPSLPHEYLKMNTAGEGLTLPLYFVG